MALRSGGVKITAYKGSPPDPNVELLIRCFVVRGEHPLAAYAPSDYETTRDASNGYAWAVWNLSDVADTVIEVLNTDTADVSVYLEFHRADGTPITSVGRTIHPQGLWGASTRDALA